MLGGGDISLANDYDNQLIESVAVRRNRLLSALLYGENPNERRWMDSVRLFLFSVALAAVIAAVCVGFSFVSNLLEENRQKQEQQRQNSAFAHVHIDGVALAGEADHFQQTGFQRPWRTLSLG